MKKYVLVNRLLFWSDMSTGKMKKMTAREEALVVIAFWHKQFSSQKS